MVQTLKDANAALYEKLMDLEMGAAERCAETAYPPRLSIPNTLYT